MAGTVRKLTRTNNKGEVKTAWIADWFDPQRKRHNKTFKTKREAEAWLNGIRAVGHNTPVLLSLHEIRKSSSPMCGIYFLFLRDKLQRIGQSANVLARIKTHHFDRRIPFDGCHVVNCNPAELDVLEALYIDKYKPPYNRELSLRRMRQTNGEAA